MSFTVLNRTYAFDNITAGNAAGQERNQSQFFPYTPGTSGGVNGDPVAGYETVFDPTSTARFIINSERMGNGQGAIGYGQEIP